MISALQRAIARLGYLLRAALQWLSRRPAAFRSWRESDRKKKKYRTLRLQKRIKPEPRDIPTSWELIKETLSFFWQHIKVFLGLIIIYAVAYVTLIRSPISTSMESIQGIVDTVFEIQGGQGVEQLVTTLGLVVGSTSTAQNTTGVAVGILTLSLATIWLTRQLHNKQLVKARDGFYQGMTGVFPVLAVLLVISLQMIPFAIASFVYITARTSQLFVSGVEDMAFFIVACMIGLLCMYWITSSVVALYIASLPGMYPLKALRTAKKIVQFQRLAVFRRLITLPIVLGVVYFAVLLLVIRFSSSYSFIAAEVMQVLAVPIVNVYLYKLYRSII